jgi:hypothetical protein
VALTDIVGNGGEELRWWSIPLDHPHHDLIVLAAAEAWRSAAPLSLYVDQLQNESSVRGFRLSAEQASPEDA